MSWQEWRTTQITEQLQQIRRLPQHINVMVKISSDCRDVRVVTDGRTEDEQNISDMHSAAVSCTASATDRRVMSVECRAEEPLCQCEKYAKQMLLLAESAAASKEKSTAAPSKCEHSALLVHNQLKRA